MFSFVLQANEFLPSNISHKNTKDNVSQPLK